MSRELLAGAAAYRYTAEALPPTCFHLVEGPCEEHEPEEMPEQLRERLEAERKRLFVGREAELFFFRSLLSSPHSGTSLLYIYGPGGIGKTTLLHQYQEMAQAAGIPAYYLNADIVDSSPSSFLQALGKTIDLDLTAWPVPLPHQSEERFVLLVDSYGALASIERWLQEEFLPALPATALIVLASRNPPSRRWRVDLGWQSVMQVIGLRNLTPDDVEEYLSRRRVPSDRGQVAVSLTHGFPLALSLLVDTYHEQPSVAFSLDAASDVVPFLLERFLENVPGPAHRSALEAAAVVRSLNEALLCALLDIPDVHDLFNWLAGLSLMELQAGGLTLHSLPRSVINADLRWRNPDWYEELSRRARNYYEQRIEKTSGAEQRAAIVDNIYLHRNNPIIEPFFLRLQQARQEASVAWIDSAREDDWPLLQEIALRYEGDESASLLAHWAEHEAQDTLVYRDENGDPLGFLLTVALNHCTTVDEEVDPAIAQTRAFLQNHAPLRAGETASLFRYWMTRESYQEISPTQSLIGVDMVRHYLTTANLAYSFMPCADPDYWYVICTYADLTRIPEADFVVGNDSYGVYGHDWRRVPVTAWLELLTKRGLSRSRTVSERSEMIEPRRTLSRLEFEAAVLEALRAYLRIDKLQKNPLLRSRLVMDRLETDAGVREGIDVLQTLLKEVADQVLNTGRSRKYYRALYHTYLQPAPSQETAAEIINVPYGTFRRHLKRAVVQLTDALWQQELGASRA